jgi:hypothetical protein
MRNINRKRDSVVDIPRRYGMDGPGFKTGGDKRFPLLYTRPYRLWGAPRLLYNGYWVSCPREKGWGNTFTTQTHFRAVVKNEYSYVSTHPVCPVACYGVTFPFTV